MINESIKVFLILVPSLMIRTAFSNTLDHLSKPAAYKEVAGTDLNAAGRYALPRSKIHIESCRRAGLLRHPGVIEKQQILHRHGDFWVRIEIQVEQGAEWFTLCNLETGQIILEQKLLDEMP